MEIEEKTDKSQLAQISDLNDIFDKQKCNVDGRYQRELSPTLRKACSSLQPHPWSCIGVDLAYRTLTRQDLYDVFGTEIASSLFRVSIKEPKPPRRL